MTDRPIEPFVVRHYGSNDRPILKGNGFDGLEVGHDREEAETFANWVNARLHLTQEAALGLNLHHYRVVNTSRALRWHPTGLQSWSASDWMTAIVGELGELASLVKMRNRERDGLPGNKFSPTQQQLEDEAADVLAYLDLFCAAQGIDLAVAVRRKFNEVSRRVGFPERL